MKAIRFVFAAIAAVALSGCADMLAVTSKEKIRESEYRRQYALKQPANVVSNCMKEALRIFAGNKSERPSAELTYLDFEKHHEIMLKAPRAVTASGPEFFVLIENDQLGASAAQSTLWVNQMLLYPRAETYLAKVSAVIEPCTIDAAGIPASRVGGFAPAGAGASAVPGQPSSFDKLERLKGLADRGVITREEFEKKKRELLDAL